ncbi:MAG: hypothetical protein JW809_10600 [Pirellulales bacterium]|nr:hypothetical protein [Pirellulales bacterium]
MNKEESAMNRPSVVRMTTLVALTVLLGWPAPGAAEVRYAVTDLSAIWRDAAVGADLIKGFSASAINDAGQIVGGYETVFGDWGAFVWDPTSGMKELGNLGRSYNTTGYAINNRGEVAGSSTTDYLSGGGPHAFRWRRDGGMLDLDGLGGNQSNAFDINDDGTVVGAAWPGNDRSHAFLWTAQTGMRDLGTLGGDESSAIAVNNLGQVIGVTSVSLDPDAPFRAFLWTESEGMRDIGGLLDINPMAINNLGSIAGVKTRPAPVPDFPWRTVDSVVVWEDGEIRDLGTLAGESTFVFAINDLGQIVGNGWVPGDDRSTLHAFLWDETYGMQDLNNVVLGDVWRIASAHDINNNGWILASGTDANGINASLLLIPVPEPNFAAMCFVVVAFFGAIKALPRTHRHPPAVEMTSRSYR